MANKDRNKRSVRKARAEERARVEAAQAASAQGSDGSDGKKPAKGVVKAEKKPTKKDETKSDKKPGPFRRLRNYLGDVRSEMRRVVWPSRDELMSYSVAIIAMLIVFGIVIWLVDSGIVAALIGFTGLRG